MQSRKQPTLRERPVAHAALLQRHDGLGARGGIKSIVESLAHVSRRRKVSTCLMGDRRCVSIAKIGLGCGESSGRMRCIPLTRLRPL
jgi:hypothetical protein